VIPARPNSHASKPTDVVRALYDYSAQNPGDISFKAGDQITVVRRTNNQNDWWTGTIRGQTGMVGPMLLWLTSTNKDPQFPANYVK
jgi:amphiphysin